MTTSQQILHSVEYTKLKGLKDLTISFDGKSVTGIFGVNGAGKSTIIHSILCLYRPVDNINKSKSEVDTVNYKFSSFFRSTNFDSWKGSELKMIHSYRINEHKYDKQSKVFSKKESRWHPKYKTRIQRPVFFIGIETCVPNIELIKSMNKINFKANSGNHLSQDIIKNASYILNNNYSNCIKSTSGKKVHKIITTDSISYSSMTMGAGEQRVLHILEKVFTAPKYALIVIDEIELTLHVDALDKMIEVLVKHCDKKNKQLIFTSHKHELGERNDINVRFIEKLEHRTLCFDGLSKGCLIKMTGIPDKFLTLYVEDIFAKCIIDKIIDEEKMRKFCQVSIYGSASNGFTVASGIILLNHNVDNNLIILDGDVYTTQEDRSTQLQQKLSGNEKDHDEKIQKASSMLKSFITNDKLAPEEFVYNALKRSNSNSEIVCDIKTYSPKPNDNHDFIKGVLIKNGNTETDLFRGYFGVIDEFSKTEEWRDYTSEIREWLNNHRLTIFNSKSTPEGSV